MKKKDNDATRRPIEREKRESVHVDDALRYHAELLLAALSRSELLLQSPLPAFMDLSVEVIEQAVGWTRVGSL